MSNDVDERLARSREELIAMIHSATGEYLTDEERRKYLLLQGEVFGCLSEQAERSLTTAMENVAGWESATGHETVKELLELLMAPCPNDEGSSLTPYREPSGASR